MKPASPFILVFCFLFCFAGCKSPKGQIQSTEDLEVLSVQNTPEILMVNFSMDSRDSVKMINSIKNPGRLRGGLHSKEEPNEGDLIISFLDETNRVCAQAIVENPLVKRIEYSETDDLSSLRAKTIALDSAEFFVRIQYDECFRYLKIEKFTGEGIIGLTFLRLFDQTP